MHPPRGIPPPHWDGEHPFRVSDLLLPEVLVSGAATSILPPLLAAGSLPSHSLISCKCHFADTLGLNWDQFPLCPVTVLEPLELRSLLSVRFQNTLKYLKNSMHFFCLSIEVYVCGGFVIFSLNMFKVSFGHNFFL